MCLLPVFSQVYTTLFFQKYVKIPEIWQRKREGATYCFGDLGLHWLGFEGDRRGREVVGGGSGYSSLRHSGKDVGERTSGVSFLSTAIRRGVMVVLQG